ncbi:uncharacterized protein LOC129598540 [Paramacrobiotus metropolitanus]|uniref:uncharacterized protein LOC129598540 n=1 Tax=Paramacrobiotus metropolitanus TaxID=2943436 RepID=UPI002445E04E|nr:uncharacterized protein LOC129598540 [Paramacrobiotus metropolitanus]
MAVARAIALHIAAVCKTDRTDAKKIKQKIGIWEQKYKAASDWLDNTGAGIEPDLNRAARLQSNKNQRINGRTTDYIIKLFPYFYDLDPVFSLRPSMLPPSMHETAVASTSAQDLMFPGRAGEVNDIDNSVDAEPQQPAPIASSSAVTSNKQPVSPDEDHRSYADRRMDGDASSESDTEITARDIKEINGAERKTMRKPPSAKTTMSFSETLMRLEQGRGSRLEKTEEAANLRAAEKAKLERDKLELQKKQLEGEIEERKIRLVEAENRRMELRLRMREAGLE